MGRKESNQTKQTTDGEDWLEEIVRITIAAIHGAVKLLDSLHAGYFFHAVC